MDLPEAKRILTAAWPAMVEDCRAVLGGELHYQAMIYHCLRNSGCPRNQIGMNVKQWVDEPITSLFRLKDEKKHIDFRGGFEPIPDIVLFSPEITGDWRRRNFANTLQHMLCAIEVKASERAKARLSTAEIRQDIAKLAAHRDELRHRGGDMLPVMLVIDVAPDVSERMKESAVSECASLAASECVAWLYMSPVVDQCILDVSGK